MGRPGADLRQRLGGADSSSASRQRDTSSRFASLAAARPAGDVLARAGRTTRCPRRRSSGRPRCRSASAASSSRRDLSGSRSSTAAASTAGHAASRRALAPPLRPRRRDHRSRDAIGARRGQARSARAQSDSNGGRLASVGAAVSGRTATRRGWGILNPLYPKVRWLGGLSRNADNPAAACQFNGFERRTVEPLKQLLLKEQAPPRAARPSVRYRTTSRKLVHRPQRAPQKIRNLARDEECCGGRRGRAAVVLAGTGTETFARRS